MLPEKFFNNGQTYTLQKKNIGINMSKTIAKKTSNGDSLEIFHLVESGLYSKEHTHVIEKGIWVPIKKGHYQRLSGDDEKDQEKIKEAISELRFMIQ